MKSLRQQAAPLKPEQERGYRESWQPAARLPKQEPAQEVLHHACRAWSLTADLWHWFQNSLLF